ncbi:MinD/ParA family protein [Marinibactrum halimedae]|uniref:Site-determining protein n=1 Tax=Marinibactrum halimedae TaxID=1444977 RepID=A0AA37WM70_9GAMM|nr:MinD/ParA family protein [Marinibactrum halimedae]MCD9459803.1 MinD/ParA family protein [Marinibactrum halimedae]GLS27004.1 site-determining protein [Marinibactrum halimedae]
MSYSRPVQVIAVTGGKGGVGKTNLSINIGIALAEMQRRVVLLDADLGLANIDVLLGLRAKHNIADVLNGEVDLKDILLNGPGGLKIVPASSGVQSMTTLTSQQHGALIHAFSGLDQHIDTMIVDTAAGISDSVISFVRASTETLVVVCDEPSSITDAYALIKILNKEYRQTRFRVIANMTRTLQEGQGLFNKLQTVCDRFLDVTLQYVGHVPFDENVRKAVQKQTPLLNFAPRCRAAQAIRSIAQKVDEWPLPNGPQGHLEFFVERLLETSSARM